MLVANLELLTTKIMIALKLDNYHCLLMSVVEVEDFEELFR